MKPKPDSSKKTFTLQDVDPVIFKNRIGNVTWFILVVNICLGSFLVPSLLVIDISPPVFCLLVVGV